MLKRLLIVTAVFIVLLVSACGSQSLNLEIPGYPPLSGIPDAPPFVFTLTPNTLTVKVNRSVKLNILNRDKAPQILVIEELNIRKMILPGTTTIRFTPEKTGRYEFYLEGLRESGSVGTLIVK